MAASRATEKPERIRESIVALNEPAAVLTRDPLLRTSGMGADPGSSSGRPCIRTCTALPPIYVHSPAVTERQNFKLNCPTTVADVAAPGLCRNVMFRCFEKYVAPRL